MPSNEYALGALARILLAAKVFREDSARISELESRYCSANLMHGPSFKMSLAERDYETIDEWRNLFIDEKIAAAVIPCDAFSPREWINGVERENDMSSQTSIITIQEEANIPTKKRILYFTLRIILEAAKPSGLDWVSMAKKYMSSVEEMLEMEQDEDEVGQTSPPMIEVDIEDYATLKKWESFLIGPIKTPTFDGPLADAEELICSITETELREIWETLDDQLRRLKEYALPKRSKKNEDESMINLRGEYAELLLPIVQSPKGIQVLNSYDKIKKNNNCESCAKACKKYEGIVRCENCNSVYHTSCIDQALNEEDIERHGKWAKKGYGWLCLACSVARYRKWSD